MITSSETDLINTAIAKAQGEMNMASETGANPHFNSSFATLKDLIEAYRKAFAKYGISVNQSADFKSDRGWVITTRLGHGNQWIVGDYPLISDKPNIQGMGSGTSYAKRYALALMLNIATQDEDDDGHGAMPPKNQPARTKSAALPSKPIPSPVPPPQNQPAASQTPQPKDTGIKPALSDAQIKRLHTIAGASGWSSEDCKTLLFANWGYTSSKQLSRQQYDEMCAVIESSPKGNALK